MLTRYLLLLAGLAAMTAPAFAEAPRRVYFGTYTGGGEDDSQGIYVADFDADSGELSNLRLAGATQNPSFLDLAYGRVEGDRRDYHLYSVSEVRDRDGRRGSGVVAWRIDPDSGELTEINRQPSGGAGPCHVAVREDGRFVAVANYGGGSASLFPRQDNGALAEATGVVQHTGGSGVVANRQAAPHAHCVAFDPSGSKLLVADLGLDQLRIYDIDRGRLEQSQPPYAELAPGAGPRHFTFTPDGRFVLVINELASTITVFEWRDGRPREVDLASTLPGDFDGTNTTAEIQVHPNGRFVYGSNRGHDSIAVFEFDPDSGALTPAGHVSSGGKTPRNFRLSPDGAWMITANQDSDNVVMYRVDSETGMPEATGAELAIPKPVCVKFWTP